jgi:hypothetical protein
VVRDALDGRRAANTEIDATAPAGAVRGRYHFYVHTPGGTRTGSTVDLLTYRAPTG